MADGCYEVFNFDTRDSDFDFAVEDEGSVSLLRFTRKRDNKPDDSVLIWVKTEWIDKIRREIDMKGKQTMKEKQEEINEATEDNELLKAEDEAAKSAETDATPPENTDAHEAAITKLFMYSSVMRMCLKVAGEVIEKEGLVSPALTGDDLKLNHKQIADLKCQIALALFNRSTRVMPEQGAIFAKALECLNMLMKDKQAEPTAYAPFMTSLPDCEHPVKDKQAETERTEKVRSEMPTAYAPFMTSLPDCEHPGLRALYDYSVGFENGSPVWLAAHNLIESMIVKSFSSQGLYGMIDMLVCPHCRALVPVEKFRSGELWDEKENKDAEMDRIAEERVVREPEQEMIDVPGLGRVPMKKTPGIFITGLPSPETCAHPGLRTLHDYWADRVGRNLDRADEVVVAIIDAMTVTGENIDQSLRCSFCCTRIPVVDIEAGIPWRNEAVKARTEAIEAEEAEKEKAEK